MTKEPRIKETVMEKRPQTSVEEINRSVLAYVEIVELMGHDSYRRVRGRIRQQRWFNEPGYDSSKLR